LTIDRLYFYPSAKSLKGFDDFGVINIDHSYTYDGYNNDFGPFTLNYVHKYCNQVRSLLNSKGKVIH